jgi:hypothetical protein
MGQVCNDDSPRVLSGCPEISLKARDRHEPFPLFRMLLVLCYQERCGEDRQALQDLRKPVDVSIREIDDIMSYVVELWKR